ncbi:MAG: hypothetical protein DI539_15460 [Flavobacterium psychrophilum]|nr:MAG: hypothetical protein DI539_15460 [Flavobacterium psychrophilum]
MKRKTQTRKICLLACSLLLWCFLAISHFTHGQSSINYSISEGMPSNEVYDTYQDTEGFVWFATDNGVVQYDGNELKILHVKDGLTDPVVFGFFEDYKKRIWFRTYSGRLSYYDPQSKKILAYAYNDKIAALVKNGIILSIYYDRSNNLWIYVTGSVIKIDKNGNISETRQPFKIFFYQKMEQGHLLGINPKNERIDTAIINGIHLPIRLSTTLSNQVICAITIEDKILFSINTDVFEFKGKKVTKVFTGRSSIVSLSKDKNDDIWVGYFNDGAEILNSQNYSSKDFNFFKKKSISKVIRDNENGYWFATLENGVYHLPNKDIDTISYSQNTIIKAAISFNNEIIAGDQKGYLHFINAESQKEISSMYMGGPIMSIFQDVERKIWVSTNASVFLLDSTYKTINQFKPLSKIDFSNGGDQYVWATGVLTTLFDIKGNVIKHTKTGIYRSILIKDSLLLLSGKIGIEIRKKNMDLIASPDELHNIKVRKIDLLNDSIALLSSIGNGPILLNLNNFKPEWLNVSKKFPADNTYAIIKIDSVLWVGTEKGVFRINNQYLFTQNTPFNHLSKLSGLLNDKIDLLVNTKKSIWAFSEDGISIIPLSENHFDNQTPKFYLKDIFVNNKKTTAGKYIHLNHDENYLKIDVGFISFNNRNIRIRFRLSETDAWSYTNNHSIEFFALSPGNYKIDMEYSTNDIVWHAAIQDLNISIKAPWWKLWYVQLGAFFALSFLVFIFIMTRISLIKQKQLHLQSLTNHQQKIIQSEIESIERERSRIAKDLHDGIGTTLTSIKMGINQVMTRYNQNEANEVENRLQDVLKEVKNIIHDLTPPALMQFGLHEGLKNYIEKISSDTHVQVKLDVFGEEIKQPKINLFVFRIIQELVINSLKHANAKNITIHLNAFDDLLNILYEDDGIGFVADEVTRGNGLYNIESRIQALQGKILFETSSKGVSYSIDIPLL